MYRFATLAGGAAGKAIDDLLRPHRCTTRIKAAVSSQFEVVCNWLHLRFLNAT
jgi:hypothetical protein